MKTLLMKANQKITIKKQGLVSKVKEFLKDETSGSKGTVEEGYLMYAGVVVGIIVLGIVILFATGAFESIGNFFNDGINGDNTNPNGWGK
ncbi:hypothetical protein MKX83_24195 [Cytobacillus sp. FSL M8-0252]|uniref:hypothetical protein n=1 Tax=Cytobacillus sp. FSL M8-0252 TaxID=2921621 RepID=UPI0030FBFFE1